MRYLRSHARASRARNNARSATLSAYPCDMSNRQLQPNNHNSTLLHLHQQAYFAACCNMESHMTLLLPIHRLDKPLVKELCM